MTFRKFQQERDNELRILSGIDTVNGVDKSMTVAGTYFGRITLEEIEQVKQQFDLMSDEKMRILSGIDATEHPPEKIAKAEEYMATCAQDPAPLWEKLRKIEEAGFYEIDVKKLGNNIRELGYFPNYQFALEHISTDNGMITPWFKKEIDDAPPKVHMQFAVAQELGVFDDYEILKVEKIPDPILVGKFKGMYFEISRWT